MPDVKRTAFVSVVCLLVLASGCVGLLTGSEPAVFAATPATVSQSALSHTDFQHEGTASPWINKTVGVAGQSRDVHVRNSVATYQLQPSVDLAGSVTVGSFTVVSTPQAAVAGQAMNPLGRLSYRQILTQSVGGSTDLKDVHRVGNRTLTVLGTRATVARFSAVASQSGQDVPVYVEVTRVQDGDDFVLAVGAYPQDADRVGSQIETLMTGIQH